MKVTKVIYLRRDDEQMCNSDITKSVYLHDELEEDFKPDHWTKLQTVEIDIPDSLIDDIIFANTKKDIDNKIAEHLASITKLEDFRNRGK